MGIGGAAGMIGVGGTVGGGVTGAGVMGAVGTCPEPVEG